MLDQCGKEALVIRIGPERALCNNLTRLGKASALKSER
jgi:hypothetical protein